MSETPQFDKSFLRNWTSHEYCYLSTVGRRTGKWHTIEIWFVVDEASIWLFTEPDGNTDWVRNLRREPRVKVRLGDMEVESLAEVVELSPDAPVRQAIAERYQHADDNLEGWAKTALVVRLTTNL